MNTSRTIQILEIPAHLFKSKLTCVTPEAREVVRKVFELKRDAPGLTTREIFTTARRHFPDRGLTQPENLVPRQELFDLPTRDERTDKLNRALGISLEPSDHPLRSMRYLKKYVLEGMAEEGIIAKLHVKHQAHIDPNGEARDPLAAKGVIRMKVPAMSFPKKTGWLWRLLTDEERAQLSRSFRDSDAKPSKDTRRAQKSRR